MRNGFYFILSLSLFFGAYCMARIKIEQPLNLKTLKLGMSLSDISSLFGTPSARSHNLFTYILHDGSELTVTLRDQRVSSAKVRFQHPIKIEDPEMRKLTLVQMGSHDKEKNNTSWFFAGKPEEGLIYKITSHGVIESLTWVPPFSVGQNAPKNLQALLRDFQSQRRL